MILLGLFGPGPNNGWGPAHGEGPPIPLQPRAILWAWTKHLAETVIFIEFTRFCDILAPGFGGIDVLFGPQPNEWGGPAAWGRTPPYPPRPRANIWSWPKQPVKTVVFGQNHGFLAKIMDFTPKSRLFGPGPNEKVRKVLKISDFRHFSDHLLTDSGPTASGWTL